MTDGSIPAYRAMPAQGGPFPTILVVQEVFGVHQYIKDICRRLAKVGYYAIAPELYARQGDPAEISDTQQLVQKIVMKVPTGQVMSGLDAAVACARASGTRPIRAKLGITGFCWGGWATWMYSPHNPRLKAAVAWYGSDRKPTELTPKNPLDIAADVKCPVLALYGGADQSIPTARRPARRASSSSIPIRRTASMQIIGRAAAPKSQRTAGLRCTSREEPR